MPTRSLIRTGPAALRRLGASLGFGLSASWAAVAAAAAPNVDGAWSPLADWPLIAVHAALTPDGRVLSYGTDGTGKQTGYFIYDVWDPEAGLGGGHMTLDNMTLTDIFCSSQIILPQSSEILIAGGDNWTGTGTTNTGNNNSNLFDWRDNTLARSANMNRARWYSSATVLVNGDVYIQGGTGGADRPEVRSAGGGFRLLTTASTSGFDAVFPRNFLAPDGRVFGYDTAGRMYYVNPNGTGSIASVGQFPSAHAGWTSSAAMFRPGRILQIGGNSNGALVIDINGPTPVATATQPMSTRRQWVSATVLPDGKVLATGGSEAENQLVGVNNRAEIWNPATGTWHVGASGARARLYHSSALLLPDATVLVAGGGAPGPLNNTNAEIYYPPYLYDAAGNFAPRPQILSATDVAEVGDVVELQVSTTAVSRVTLVKTGSVTHSVNMDQRFLELPFSRSGNSVYAQLPQRASDLPPGFYMLFVIDSAGVPSKASMLRINVDTTPSTAVDYTQTIGGGGGSPFTRACEADEVLVGIHGRAGTYVHRLGAQCVAVDQFGRWIGNPVARPVTGTQSTGTDFNKLCPRDWAVSGFRGRAAQYLDQLDIQCRALTPSGGLTGTPVYLGPVGSNGGTQQGPFSCGTANPAYALYGRSGSWLDSFGILCRTASITPISTNSVPVIVSPGNQTATVGVPVDLALQASDSDGDALTFSATGLPPGLSIGAATGRTTGTPSTAGSYSVTVTVRDAESSAQASFTWSVEATPALVVAPMPPQPPRTVGTAISYTAQASGGVNVRYKWQFGDGSPETPWSTSATVQHTFTSPGVHFVTLTVTDDQGPAQIQSFAQPVHLPLTSAPGRNSGNLAFETARNRLWVVNQDNDSVSVFDAATHARIREIAVGDAPRAIAIAPDGRIWVTNKGSASISIINPSTLTVATTRALPRGSQPFGVVFAQQSNVAFVALEGSGRLLKLNASTAAELGALDVGPWPRHVSIDGSEQSVYVSRFITPPQPGEDSAVLGDGSATGGEVLVVDPVSLTIVRTVTLRHSDKLDAENQGAGVPNYLGAVTISPDGRRALVPSKQDNIGRGMLRSGANLNFQNTVRAISSTLDLVAGVEDYARRIDHDNASVASAAAHDPWGLYAFVALETSREVAVIDAHGGHELFRIEVGRAPQGVLVSPDGKRLYVNNFMDRTVDVFDLDGLMKTAQWNVPRLATLGSIGTEALPANVLAGKRLFYDARDTRLARDRYMSCASCHNDGGHDGRVWDLTGMGEGLRNTISLRGTGAAHGRLHWTQNFDEVQDFEGQIRTLAGGTGLMSDSAFNSGTRSQPLGTPKAGVSADLDALAAYVASLTEFDASPYRNANGTLTAAGVAGREVFRAKNCAACHGGTRFTDSGAGNLHDIGTLKPTSGSRLGGALNGIDTPTLRGVWRSAPYLHDGSAATLAEAVAAHRNVTLGSSDLDALVAYLAQIDDLEASAPVPNRAPLITNPGNQSGNVGQSVSLSISASDPDGDSLTFRATGLPTGLSINAASGRISGTPTAGGSWSVTVTADDGALTASVTFTFHVSAADTIPPSKPGRPSSSSLGGDAVLSWSPSTDNVGVVGYIVYRSTSSGSLGSEVGRTSTPNFRDRTAGAWRAYYYSVRAYDAAGNLSTPSDNRLVLLLW